MHGFHIQSDLCYETAQRTDHEKLWSHETRILLTQVNYSGNCTFGTLKGLSLNTGGLKDTVDCILKHTQNEENTVKQLICKRHSVSNISQIATCST